MGFANQTGKPRNKRAVKAPGNKRSAPTLKGSWLYASPREWSDTNVPCARCAREGNQVNNNAIGVSFERIERYSRNAPRRSHRDSELVWRKFWWSAAWDCPTSDWRQGVPVGTGLSCSAYIAAGCRTC